MLSNRFFIKILLCVLSPITLLCTHRKQKSAAPAKWLVQRSAFCTLEIYRPLR